MITFMVENQMQQKDTDDLKGIIYNHIKYEGGLISH